MMISNNTNSSLSNNMNNTNVTNSAVVGWEATVGIYNLLIVFYAEYENDDLLIEFLTSLQERASVQFDIQFALRFCEEKNKQRAILLLYGLINMYEEAVIKALERNDLKLAKYNACRPSDDTLKKRLWLLIVDHMAQQEDVKELIQLVKQSDGYLKIQDVLPFISDSTLIDNFKDDICNSLSEYEKRIQERKEEMEDHRKAVVALKKDLKAVNQRCVVLSVKQLCEICRDVVFSQKFFAFPCRHTFHSSCLQKIKYFTLEKDKQKQFDSIVNELEKGIRENKPQQYLQQLEIELDDMLGDECAICGNVMIKAINVPFLGDDENAEEIESWKIETSTTNNI